ALNKNPFIGKVPCHRVIRSDGSVGGFARGTEEKRKMLKRELVDRIL
ncbi:MAG: MGMT family protein, partial [Candidatus Omnitrophota bacterium]